MATADSEAAKVLIEFGSRPLPQAGVRYFNKY